MKLEEFKNKKILIVGRGIEGKAAFSYLTKHFPNNVIEIVDQKDGTGYLDKQKDFDITVKSPGIKSELITIPYTTSTNIFMSNAKGKVIGVTGTKGKSTTATLIFEIINKDRKNVYFGGNIGKASLDFLDKLNDQSWTVLEISSFQLKDLKTSPHMAILLMIAEEHLDYHKTLQDYIDAKRNILRFQKNDDFAIVNRDYPASHESDVYTSAKLFQISMERECKDGCFVQNDSIWIEREGEKQKIIDTKDIKLLGKHNLENVCAAVMAAILAGVSKKTIVDVLKKFRGLDHRLEFVGEKNGVTFYNDSLATIPQATIQALESLPQTETLIAGGHDRGINFTPLAEFLAKSHQIKTLILFPPTGIIIWDEICKAMLKEERPEKFDVKTMEQAVRIVAAETAPGKICLLSPASASFGIFKNYKDRGEQFKKEIEKLKS